MKSNRPPHMTPTFIGADLTDRYAKTCRPIDVCGLKPGPQGGLRASFWTWEWDSPDRELIVDEIIAELDACELAMLDGPQGLAGPGNTMRECERRLGAAGKTPDTLPQPRAFPFAGYIRSSLELFHGLSVDMNLLLSSKDPSGKLAEVYPGQLWKELAASGLRANHALPKKSGPEGRAVRKAILESLGVSFDESFEPRSHDQLDACVSAVTAAAYRNRIDGLHTRFVGTPVFRDDDGSLREGEIMCLRPKEASALGKRLNHAVTAGPQVEASASRRTRRPRPVPQHQPLRPRTKAYASELKSQLTEGDPQRRASQTLAWLVQQAGEESNDPVLLSYGAAWRLVYLQPNPTGHGANAYKPVIELARLIGPIHLANLGPVMLDCFLVNASKKSPGEGHWQTAQYDEDEWARVFGNATVIKASDVVL